MTDPLLAQDQEMFARVAELKRRARETEKDRQNAPPEPTDAAR